MCNQCVWSSEYKSCCDQRRKYWKCKFNIVYFFTTLLFLKRSRQFSVVCEESFASKCLICRCVCFCVPHNLDGCFKIECLSSSENALKSLGNFELFLLLLKASCLYSSCWRALGKKLPTSQFHSLIHSCFFIFLFSQFRKAFVVGCFVLLSWMQHLEH